MTGDKKISDIDRMIEKINFILEDRQAMIEQIQSKVAMTEEEKIWVGQEISLHRIVQSMKRMFLQRVNDSLGQIRPMPSALDLEEAVLGALMIESNALKAVYKFLRPEHFFSEEHRLIYEGVLRLIIDREPVDMRSVVIKLNKSGTLQRAGGPFKIAEMTSKVSSAANIEYHARIIVEMAIKRDLMYMGSDMLKMGYDDTQDVFKMLDEFEKRFTNIHSIIHLNAEPTAEEEKGTDTI